MPAEPARPSLARNMRRIGHLDLPGGGQVSVVGRHAYVGHIKSPHGTSILDVADPHKPRVIGAIRLENDPYSHTHKARVVGDIMITNYEQANRHFLRKGDKIPAIRERLGRELGRPPAPREIAAALGVSETDLPALDAARERGYRDGGFKIYDVSDKTRPRLIHYERTHGFGVHRFDMDARYAYISTEMPGFVGNILVIYDLAEPARPKEVSRWWIPGQNVAGGETPTWEDDDHRLHHALRVGDRMWAAMWYGGFRVVDVSDIAQPCTIGAHQYHPPFPEPTHTILPLPQAIGGRTYAVVADEQQKKHRRGQAHANLWLFDVTDISDIRPVSQFHVSELDSPWSAPPAWFGCHQFQEHFSDTRVFATWFAGGLRVVDFADPFRPEEIAHFIPEPCGGAPRPASNDVDVDDRGLIYLLDRDCGLDILEMDV